MTKHNAYIQREVYERNYYARESRSLREHLVESDRDLVETELLWEGELESPILSPKDEIFIREIDELVRIKKVVRTTDNSIVYYTQDRVIEDKDQERYKEAYKEAQRLNQEMKDQQDIETILETKEEVKVNWFKRLFKK